MTPRLTFYVVFRNPRDYPNKFVVRRQHVRAGHVEIEATPLAVVDTVREAHEALPDGLVYIPPSPNDDPVIVEIWV